MADRLPRSRPGAASPRALAIALALVALATAAALGAAPALALSAAPHLQDRVTDQANVLSGADVDRISSALKQLESDRAIQLFVAFIDTTGDTNVTTFAADTAAASSLGGNDALLLVAIEDRSDAMWVGDALDEVTNDEIDAILTGGVEPRLADGDFAAAAISGAEGLGQAATATVVSTVPPAQPQETTVPANGGSGAGSSAGGFNLTPVIAVLLLLGGGFLVVRSIVDRRRRDAQAKATHDTLSRDANRALLASDEALKDAANDVDFAAAQWGEQEVTAYRRAIATATGELRAAFEIRQRLDDAEPETPPEQASMLQEILARTATVKRLLDEQEQRFDQLRDLEQTAPAQLDALVPALAALGSRQAAAAAEAQRIAAAYAPSAVTSVAGNAAEAAKALASASAETSRGQGIAATRRSEAVVALRRAQDGAARATQLIEAVERLGARLDDAAARLPAELDAAAADVATAGAAVRDGRSLPPLAPGTSLVPPVAPGAPMPAPTDPAIALAQAERLLGEAQRAAEARPMDPLAALERATQANNAADAIIAGIREAETQRARRLQVAATAVASAHGHVTRATDYITTRRHGVGREARTRAAEAQLRLEEAQRLAATDPDASIASAQRATQLADEAYRLASSEFDGWDQGGGPVAGPYTRGSGDAQVIGAVIGGVLGSILSGAGRGSGWGGSPWGGPTGGSRGGGGFGMPGGFGGGGGGIGLPGPFGGGGGGGGGRVRGGRW
ncbi:MAG TPA: TPM domain-containing protein [Candidatus Limnocylindrales bacterium]|jgi:uncharacterized membrane protein YgcG